jgi:hypothetical protein
MCTTYVSINKGIIKMNEKFQVRLNPALLIKVNNKRKKQGITWRLLVESLFVNYLKDGVYLTRLMGRK